MEALFDQQDVVENPECFGVMRTSGKQTETF